MNPRLALLGATALALACTGNNGDSGNKGEVGEASFDGVAPDWALFDVNATSPTFGDEVSPTDLRGQVSVWYFGHST